MSITLSLLNFSQGGLDVILNIQEYRQLLAYNLYLKTAFLSYVIKPKLVVRSMWSFFITLPTLYSVFPSMLNFSFHTMPQFLVEKTQSCFRHSQRYIRLKEPVSIF